MKKCDISKIDNLTIMHVIGLLEMEIDSIAPELKDFKNRYKKGKISFNEYIGAESYYKPMLKAYKRMFKFLSDIDNIKNEKDILQ